MRMRKKKNLLPRMERCAALQIKDPIAHRGHWRELMPEARELRVELGCGKGRFTAGTAAAEPDVLFIATGSEVSLCIEAAKRLAETGRSARVVSMPCRELFERQPLTYRESIVPGTCAKRVIVEAGVKFGWERYAINSATTRYVTLDTFGASAPYKVLAEQFGFTVDNVYAQAREMMS